MAIEFSTTEAFLKVVQQNLSAPDPKVIRQLRKRPRPVLNEPAVSRA